MIDAEPLQARVARLHHVVGLAVGAGLAVGQPDVAELGREHIFVAPALERAPDQFLVRAVRAIGVRRVDEIDAGLGRAMDGRDRLVRIRLAVDRRHAHAAEPDGRDLQRAKFSAFHHYVPRPRCASLRPQLLHRWAPAGRASTFCRRRRRNKQQGAALKPSADELFARPNRRDGRNGNLCLALSGRGNRQDTRCATARVIGVSCLRVRHSVQRPERQRLLSVSSRPKNGKRRTLRRPRSYGGAQEPSVRNACPCHQQIEWPLSPGADQRSGAVRPRP